MEGKKKLIIISAGYPYGPRETFLHNEVLFLSERFDIEIFPLLKKYVTDAIVDLPPNVTYNQPVLTKNYLARLAKGIFNTSPFLPYIGDLFKIVKTPRFWKAHLSQWVLNMLVFRTFYSSRQYNRIKGSSAPLVYFYWANMPFSLMKDIQKKFFIRVHGGEIDLERSNGYIPMIDRRISTKPWIQYLPISQRAADQLSSINTAPYTINRLGVYDNGLNPNIVPEAPIHIVSCSNLIPLKRVHLIIDALRMIPVNIQWVHFGDGPLLQATKDACKSLPGNITVTLAGRIPNSEILTYYATHPVDLFINVSETEGVPVSIMEAFSFGIPCFATNVGGTNEIVNDTNGYLAAKDFALLELADFIKGIRTSPADKVLRENARHSFESSCDAKKNYTRLAGFFNEQIAQTLLPQ